MSPSTSRTQPLVALALALFGAALVFGGTALAISARWYMPLLLLPPLLLGAHHIARLPRAGRWALLALALSVAAVYGIAIGRRAAADIASPPEWDFLSFWIFARAAVQGADFYDGAVLRAIAAPLSPSTELLAELTFWHPPPAMLLFAPLGLADIRTAALGWAALHGLLLLAAIAVLWRAFFAELRVYGLAIMAALVLMLHSTFVTVAFGQTNFLLLLLLAAFWRSPGGARRGAWAGLALCVKPLMAVLLLFLLLRGKWRELAGAIAAAAGVALVALAVFGPQPYVSYVTRLPAANVPAVMYTEEMNQSLLATIIRLTHAQLAAGAPTSNPLFLAAALALGAVTAGLVLLLPAEREQQALALCVALGLLIYPATLIHYSVYLIVPMLALWAQRGRLGGPWPAAAFLGAEAALLGYRGGALAFAAFALMWLAYAGLSAYDVRWGARRDVQIVTQPRMRI